MGLFFKKLFMTLALKMFELIDTIFDVFKSLAGIDRVNAHGEEVTLIDYFFGQSTLYQVFFGIIICSIAVLAVCMVASIVKSIVNMHGGERKSHAKTVGQGVGSVVISLTLAVVMIAGISASDVLLNTLYKTMNVGNTTVAQTVFDAAVESSYTYDYWDVQKLRRSYEPDGTAIDEMAYLYDYAGFDPQSNYSWAKPNDAQSYLNTDHRLTQFNRPRGDGGSVDWGSKYPEGEKLDEKEVWIHVKASDDQTTWERMPDELQTDKDTSSLTVSYSRAYLGADGEYYALNVSKLTPVTSSGWTPGYGKEDINFAAETADTVYGEYKTYKVLPVFENEKKPETVGKIRVGSFNYIIAFLCGIIVLIALCSTMLGLVKRLYDLVILFLTLPLITATIPLDDGAKFKLWRETVISKIVLAYGSVFAICVFMLIAPQIGGLQLASHSGTLVNSIFQVFLICGGALTISGGQLLFARLIGGSAEESREMAQSARTIAAGAGAIYGGSKAVGRGLFGYRNANGQRVGGLIKGGVGALGAVGGGTVNAIGSALGGQAYKASKFAQKSSAVSQALRGFGNSSGWIGQDKTTGGNTLGSAIGSGMGALGGKLAGSSRAQKMGIDRGITGVASAIRQKVSKSYSTQVDAESHARDRANDLAAAFGVSPYAVKHVKDKRKSE